MKTALAVYTERWLRQLGPEAIRSVPCTNSAGRWRTSAPNSPCQRGGSTSQLFFSWRAGSRAFLRISWAETKRGKKPEPKGGGDESEGEVDKKGRKWPKPEVARWCEKYWNEGSWLCRSRECSITHRLDCHDDEKFRRAAVRDRRLSEPEGEANN